MFLPPIKFVKLAKKVGAIFKSTKTNLLFKKLDSVFDDSYKYFQKLSPQKANSTEILFKFTDDFTAKLEKGIDPLKKDIRDLTKKIEDNIFGAEKKLDNIVGDILELESVKKLALKYGDDFVKAGRKDVLKKYADEFANVIEEANSIAMQSKFADDILKSDTQLSLPAYLKKRTQLFINNKKGDKFEKLFVNIFGGFKPDGSITTSLTKRFLDAYISGIYNGLIDTIVGVFTILSFSFEMQINLIEEGTLSFIKSVFENLGAAVDAIIGIDWIEVIKVSTGSVFEIIAYLIETVGPVVVDKLEDIKFIFIAYFLGLVAYEVIESFLPPLKATKLGKKVGLLFKSVNTKKAFDKFNDIFTGLTPNTTKLSPNNPASKNLLVEALKEFTALLKKGTPNLTAQIKIIFQKLFKFIDDILVKLGVKKAGKFIFKGFSKNFDDHLLRGEIKITIKDAQDPKKIKEIYKYATGKGGINASDIKPPWQVKTDVSGLHMHQYIDDKILRKISVDDFKNLPTGETVEIVKIEFFVKELNKFVKKKNSSTLWPKEWSLDKIKRITQEASENVIKNDRSKFLGISKEGYQVEFFSKKDGIIDNAYLNFEELK